MNFSAGNNEYVGYTNMDITSRVPLDATSDLPQTEPLDVANSDHYGIAADFQTVGTSENYSLTRNDRRYGYQNNSEGFMRDIPGTSSQSHIHQRGFINEEYQSFNTVDPMFDPDQLQLHCSSNNLYSNVESQTKFFAVPEFVNESSTSLNVSRPSNGYDQRSATSLNNFEVFQNTPTRSCSTFRQSIESERKLRIKASNQRSQAKLRAHNKLVVQTFEENDQLINKMRTEFNNGKDSKELLTYLLNGYKFLPSLKSLAPPQVLSSEKSIPQRDPTFMNVAYASVPVQAEISEKRKMCSTRKEIAESSRIIFPHIFEVHSYFKLTKCDYCGKLLKGLFKQGIQCQKCNYNCHNKCKQYITNDCPAPASSFCVDKSQQKSTLTQKLTSLSLKTKVQKEAMSTQQN